MAGKKGVRSNLPERPEGGHHACMVVAQIGPDPLFPVCADAIPRPWWSQWMDWSAAGGWLGQLARLGGEAARGVQAPPWKPLLLGSTSTRRRRGWSGGLSAEHRVVLQHHFAIGEMHGFVHKGRMIEGAGQFSGKYSWRGGPCHEDGRTARSGGRIGETAPAVCALVWAGGKPGAFLGVSAGLALGGRTQEPGADGLGLWRPEAEQAGDRTGQRPGVATVSDGFLVGGGEGATRDSSGV
jgi:hypothetical protein